MAATMRVEGRITRTAEGISLRVRVQQGRKNARTLATSPASTGRQAWGWLHCVTPSYLSQSYITPPRSLR